MYLLYACANQGSLSGGEKDESPPTLLAAVPENGSTNVSPTTLTFSFDENIQLKNLSRDLLISPVLTNKPTIKQTAKGFTIEINEPLKENTTYTFNFGNAIQDLNEGNPIPGFQYVFSTGYEIDEGAFSGSVIDAETSEAPEELDNLWAVLYDANSDSIVTENRPEYVAPIQEDGSFQFSYIQEKAYQIYLIKDQNFNYYYDLPNESIAFVETEFSASSDSIVNVGEFSLFTPEQATANITYFHQENHRFVVKANQPIETFTFRDSIGELDKYYFNQYQDSLIGYLPLNASENKLYSEWKGERVDTNVIQAIRPEEIDSSFTVNVRNTNQFSSYKPLYLEANQPFSSQIIKDSIVLLEDSLYVAGGVLFEPDSLFANRLYFNYDWRAGSLYTIQFADSTFQSIYGHYSKSIEDSFNVPNLDELGTLILNTSKLNPDVSYILELQKGNDTIEQLYLPIQRDNSYTFKALPTGNYTVKLIEDLNANGQWDTGSWELLKQPERILFFRDQINIRGNWDVEVELQY